jgi:hypothetical protein
MSVLQNSLCDTSGSFSLSHASPAPGSYTCVSAGWRAVQVGWVEPRTGTRSENSNGLCKQNARDAYIHREQQPHLGAASSTALGFYSLCAIAAEVCRHHFAQVKVLLTRSLPVEGLCCRPALLSSANDRRFLDVCALTIATADAQEQEPTQHCAHFSKPFLQYVISRITQSTPKVQCRYHHPRQQQWRVGGKNRGQVLPARANRPVRALARSCQRGARIRCLSSATREFRLASSARYRHSIYRYMYGIEPLPRVTLHTHASIVHVHTHT